MRRRRVVGARDKDRGAEGEEVMGLCREREE